MNTLTDQLLRIPMAELHVHLRGMLRHGVFTELMMKHGESEPWLQAPARHREMFSRYPNIAGFIKRSDWDERSIQSFFRFKSFEQFLATWCFTGYLIRDIDDFALLVNGALDYLEGEYVVYAEITVSPSEYLSDSLSFSQLVEILHDASVRSPIGIRWIFDLVRDNGPERADHLLNELLSHRADSIVGITLGGTEHRFPPAQFEKLYGKAKRNGLRLTVHAGESLGPESIWDAISVLQVERIGHGISAAEDPELMRLLAERNIPLEICPTSNIRTGLYGSYEEHPMKTLFEQGIPVTVNSDDPVFFGTTLHGELTHAASMGFDIHDIVSIILNGYRCAFMEEEKKRDYLTETTRELKRRGIQVKDQAL